MHLCGIARLYRQNAKALEVIPVSKSSQFLLEDSWVLEEMEVLPRRYVCYLGDVMYVLPASCAYKWAQLVILIYNSGRLTPETFLRFDVIALAALGRQVWFYRDFECRGVQKCFFMCVYRLHYSSKQNKVFYLIISILCTVSIKLSIKLKLKQIDICIQKDS